MKETVSARLEKAQVEALERFTRRTGGDRAQLLRQAVARGLHDLRLEEAARRSATGTLSLSAAAELAEVPVPDVLDAMRRLGLTLPYDGSDLAEDLAWASSSTQAS